MSAVPPPPSAPVSAPPPAAAPSAPPLTTAAVPSPPNALAQMPPGTRLDAVVISEPRNGTVEVQTSAGKVTLETPLPLPKNALLALLVAAREPVFRLTILSVDGTPAQVFAKLAAQTPAPAPGLSAQAALVTLSSSGAVLTPGLSLTATLLTPGRFIPAPGSAQSLASGGGGASANASGNVPGNVSGSVPGAAHVGGHVRALNLFGQAGRGQGPGQAAGAGGAPGAAAGRPLFAAAGSTARVTVISLTPPGPGAQPAPQPPSAGGAPFRPGMVLHGAVTGQTRAGHAIVQTQAGAVTLPSAPPPMGARISFTLDTAPKPPPGGSNAVSAGAVKALLRAPAWPSFTDAMQTLERADPGLAQQVAAGVLPNPAARGGALAASILAFLGALKTGDIRAALGDAAMRAIERARPAAAARLDGDFRGLSRAADDPDTGGEWRVAAVPLALGPSVQPVRLLMRRRRGKNGGNTGNPEDGGPENGGRFVVDVTLQKMGRVQLDGASHDGGARLDLIVRTERRLPSGAQNDIRSMFADAAALTGTAGGLAFQAGPGAFVEFDGGAEPAPGAHVGVEA